MMRVCFSTTAEQAFQILGTGFTDLSALGDAAGVYVGEWPLDANDGYPGDVILTIDIPVDVFDRYEEFESDDVECGLEIRTGRALIPASLLNWYGPARVYAHRYAGDSRRDMLEASRDAKAAGDRKHAAVLCAAMRFMDTIGWRTPLKVREQHDNL